MLVCAEEMGGEWLEVQRRTKIESRHQLRKNELMMERQNPVSRGIPLGFW